MNQDWILKGFVWELTNSSQDPFHPGQTERVLTNEPTLDSLHELLDKMFAEGYDFQKIERIGEVWGLGNK